MTVGQRRMVKKTRKQDRKENQKNFFCRFFFCVNKQILFVSWFKVETEFYCQAKHCAPLKLSPIRNAVSDLIRFEPFKMDDLK